jgi:N-ethylmaleimide reductase
MHSLFSPIQIGPLLAKNRVFMAPLTRSRADDLEVPTDLIAQHYADRASAGLLISEASPISQQGRGYPWTPGLFSDEQVRGWTAVTDAVHANGGLIFAQLWHVGRISHPDFQPGGALPVAPSAINPGGEARTPTGMKPRVTPRALELHEIATILDDYRHAAANAKRAGFDGVELHGANGYLPDQFLRDGTNHRTDAYGGPIPNRARFLLEAAQACIDVWGADRVGVRLNPSINTPTMLDSTPSETFAFAVRELARLRVAYLHIMERVSYGDDPPPDPDDPTNIPVGFFRPMYDGVLIANAGFTYDKADRYLREGWADAVAFGRLFLANPDLPERLRRQAAGLPVTFNQPDRSTFYTRGPKGYNDYPFLPDS